MMSDLKDNSSSKFPKQTAQTLVFFDLESTGLPFSVGKKNVQITELSLIAVDRTEFENSEDVRILNKLNLTVKPRSSVSFEAIHMTGLCNTSLQYQENFSQSTAQLLQLFCQRLNQPVCLLAHNGRRFDFPVLQAELKNVGAKLSDTVYCADTIEAFKNILLKQDSPETDITSSDRNPETTQFSPKGFNGSEQQLTPVIRACHTAQSSAQYYYVDTLTNDNVDELLCQEMEIFEHLISNDQHVDSLLSSPINNTTNGDLNNGGDNLFGVCSSLEKTPLGKTTNIPTRPEKGKVSVLEQTTPNKKEKNHSSARRKLFNKGDAVENGRSEVCKNSEDKKSKMSFSLRNLYHHFFGCDVPMAHFAEGDCIALMKVSRELKGFLPWVDEHMILFNSVKSLW